MRVFGCGCGCRWNISTSAIRCRWNSLFIVRVIPMCLAVSLVYWNEHGARMAVSFAVNVTLIMFDRNASGQPIAWRRTWTGHEFFSQSIVFPFQKTCVINIRRLKIEKRIPNMNVNRRPQTHQPYSMFYEGLDCRPTQKNWTNIYCVLWTTIGRGRARTLSFLPERVLSWF